MPNVANSASLGIPLEFMSLEECDKKCLQNPNCVMFNYYTKDSSCCILEHESEIHLLRDGCIERHIVRCNPALGELAFQKSYLISDLYSTMLLELQLLRVLPKFDSLTLECVVYVYSFYLSIRQSLPPNSSHDAIALL